MSQESPPPGSESPSAAYRQSEETPAFELTSPDLPIRANTPANLATPDHVDQMTEHHGWFRQQLMIIEAALWGRWPYWLATVLNRRLGPLPEWSIPQIKFGSIQGSSLPKHPDPNISAMVGTADEAKKQVFKAFGDALYTGGYLGDLFRWWLYAFGSPTVTERPELNDEAKVAMYSGLNLGWLLGHPGDWGAELCLEFLGPDRRGGWFPTPITVTEMMVRMTMPQSGVDTRPMSVHDPCVGTGVMLLCASNYSLNLSGQDINQTMCLACEFNGWLFVPWLVYGQGAVRELREHAISTASPEPPSSTGPPNAVPSGHEPRDAVRVTQRPQETQGQLFGET